MSHSRFERTILYLLYLALCWIAIDGIVAYSGLMVPEERVRWFSDFFMPDPTLGFRIRPNLVDYKLTWMKGDVSGTYSTDSLGFRNAGRVYKSAHNYFIGDSFTFGAWVPRDKTFYGRLEGALGEPVITFGVGGYGLVQYDRILRTYCADLSPESRIYLCLFANDLEPLPDSATLSNYYSWSGWQPFTRHATFMQRLAPSRTLTYNLARETARVMFGYGDYAPASDGTILYKRRGANERYLTDKLYTAFEDRLAGMIDFCRHHDLRLTILLFPSKEAVYRDEYERLFGDSHYLDVEKKGFRRIESAASRRNVPVLNLTEFFRRHRGDRLFFKYDPHCDESGHELVADTLLSRLALPTSDTL